MLTKKAAMFWSGGKDSSLALYKVTQEFKDLEVCFLVTTLNQEYRRISMHGVREEMLEKQANAIGIPLLKMEVPNLPDNNCYEHELNKILRTLASQGISHIVFGDIFLEDLKKYREAILHKHNLTGVFPLWRSSTDVLIKQFLGLEFKTVTCCISTETLSEKFVGKELDHEFLDKLPSTVDPCGENGEFHTFCFDGPIFRHPILFSLGEKKYVPLEIKSTSSRKETGFWYIDIF